MTREEAIRIIETVFQDEYVYKYYDSITHQALNMAIEALNNSIQMSNIQQLEAENGVLKELIKFYREQLTVEVVRCKDCRHGWYDDDIEYYTCRHPKGLNEELYGVDFCSYGEKKE